MWWSAAGVLSLSWSCYTIEWGTSQFDGSASSAVPVLGGFDLANSFNPAEKINLNFTSWA